MTQPTTEPTPDVDLHPFDILMNVIVLLIAPMFLTASGGDLAFARMAACETINAYGAKDHLDLLSIAQVLGYSLAALGSLSLSMSDDISLAMTLRLRGNANALNRCAEQNRRALRDRRPEPEPSQAPEPAATEYENAVLASVAETQKRVAQVQSRLKAEAPAAPQAHAAPQAPTPAAAPTPASLTHRENNAIWAAGMAEVAAEYTASLIHLPPAERRAATIRVTALNSAANALLEGAVAPRLRPGDLAAMNRPSSPPGR
jgi:hypothetical protein